MSGPDNETPLEAELRRRGEFQKKNNEIAVRRGERPINSNWEEEFKKMNDAIPDPKKGREV